MMIIGYGRRLGYLALSGFAGWFAGQIATFPANLITAARDSEGASRLFVESIALGLVAWGGWTFLLSLGALVLIGLPLVFTVRPCLMVRLRIPIFCTSAALATAVTIAKLHSFRDDSASTRLMQFFSALPYGVFAVVFAVVTAWTYIELARRRLESEESGTEVTGQSQKVYG